MTCARLLVSTLTIYLLLAGCGGPEPKAANEPAGPLVSEVTPDEALLEKLAAADAKDGTEDKVITLCPSCGLGMAGKPEFSCKIGEYTTHSCAEHCNRAVCEDPEKVFGAIEIPK